MILFFEVSHSLRQRINRPEYLKGLLTTSTRLLSPPAATYIQLPVRSSC